MWYGLVLHDDLIGIARSDPFPVLDVPFPFRSFLFQQVTDSGLRENRRVFHPVVRPSVFFFAQEIGSAGLQAQDLSGKRPVA